MVQQQLQTAKEDLSQSRSETHALTQQLATLQEQLKQARESSTAKEATQQGQLQSAQGARQDWAYVHSA